MVSISIRARSYGKRMRIALCISDLHSMGEWTVEFRMSVSAGTVEATPPAPSICAMIEEAEMSPG